MEVGKNYDDGIWFSFSCIVSSWNDEMIHAQLINNYGFSKTMELENLTQTVNIPIVKNIPAITHKTISANISFDPIRSIEVLTFHLDEVKYVGKIQFATYREK